MNEGNVLRKQAQLEQLRAKIDEEMRKKGIESAIVSDVISKKDPLPVLDWWHLPFVKNIETFSNVVAASKYDPVETSSAVKSLLNLDNVSRAIIHPVPFFGRVKGPEAPTVKPLVLTEAEQKKLRRQRRLEEQKLKREKINLGLLPKEETKLKLSNYMAVMGNEALSDPTKAEAVVRAQIQARQEAHLAANSSRQLSKEERAEKERLKLAREFYHPKDGFLQVLAFRLLRLDIPKWKFKIKANASQLHIFGCMIQHRQQN